MGPFTPGLFPSATLIIQPAWSGPSDIYTAQLICPHLFGPVTFSPQIFHPPLSGGGRIVTYDI
jgi:hypothetical protein